MTEVLRPLTLGEILDRTMQLYRRNFALFAGTAALPMLALVGVGVMLGILALPIGIATARHTSSSLPVLLLAPVALIFIAVAIAATVITQAAVTGAAIGVVQGRRMKVREALASVRPRFWRYLGLMVLQVLFAAGIPTVAMSFVFVPAWFFGRGAGGAFALIFISAIAAFVAEVMLVMRIAMGMAVCVAEDRPAAASLKRAIRLSKGTRGRIFAMFLIVWALTYALMTVAYIPIFIVLAVVGVAARGGAGAIAAVVVAECVYFLIAFAIQTIAPPAYLIALVLFYYDERIRKEGFDIELLMQQAGLAATVPAAGPELAPSPDAHSTAHEQV